MTPETVTAGEGEYVWVEYDPATGTVIAVHVEKASP